MNNLKQCTSCKLSKELKDFNVDNSRKNKLAIYCKTCEAKKKTYRRLKYPWKRTFESIKQRCYNINNKKYNRYGGRGIKCLITEAELKEIWFRDKAYELKKPSIDRIDNNGHYEYNNCRYIEFSLNSIKDYIKPITQYSLNDIFIKNWKSLTEAAESLNINISNLSSCLNKKLKSCGGFKWSLTCNH
jgi:hypothetical protein